ncbi:MAG: Mov34/MPN/PAD-1 family protein [Candidatus Micrarchaeota archaeon]
MAEFKVYLHASAFDKAREHFAKAFETGIEAMGLLVGEYYSNDGGFLLVSDYVTADNQATSVSVRFEESAFSAIAGELLARIDSSFVVGWAHSHPGYGCHLSSTDLDTQKTYFNEEYHVALVIDPSTNDAKVFKLDGDDYKEVSFAVVRKKNGV